jgi:ABC-type branched-subunit amino acid transport system permease subunit
MTIVAATMGFYMLRSTCVPRTINNFGFTRFQKASSYHWYMLFMGIMFLFVIMFAPQGIVGAIKKYLGQLVSSIGAWFSSRRNDTW